MISRLILVASHALRVIKGRAGQSLVEYALVLSFISLLSVVFMSIFAAHLRSIFMAIVAALEAARSAI
jgi:Flp pilus assembly pilin Flp